MAELQLKYIPTNIKISDLGRVKSAKDVLEFVNNLFNQDTISLTEQFIIIYLNRNMNIIAYNYHSHGGVTGTVAEIRLIVATALKCVASSIIISHNHPSGNINPSSADVKLTNRVKKALEVFDVNLLDHLIVTPNKDQYFSFAESGKL